MNIVILSGNLGKDPEVRHIDTGKAVANFSLATTKKYKNKAGELQTVTSWHNITMWSPLAELAEKYLKKGYKIGLRGELNTRSYDDKNGNKKYITEVVASELEFLGSKPENRNQEPNQESNQEVVNESETDDLPF